MDTKEYFKSLSHELEALKNRVRQFIDTNHWQTDGEWKESVLRATLNQHLPNHVEAARGFVINEEESSSQIDVLLFDNRKPVLFRDGDLVFATPDSVLGIIEVKSSIQNNGDLLRFGRKLADNASWICNASLLDPVVPDQLFVGLFAYEMNGEINHFQSLESIQRASEHQRDRVINHVTIGENYFTRFWPFNPNEQENDPYNRWHSYDTPNLARGYFLHNVLHHVSDTSVSVNRFLYFPKEGKEGWNEAEIPLEAI